MTDAAVKAVGFAKRTDGKEMIDEGRSGENSRLHQRKHGEKRQHGYSVKIGGMSVFIEHFVG